VSNGRHAPELASSALEQAADLSGRPLIAASSRNVPRIERQCNRPNRRTDWNDLRYFLAIARGGSTGAAAKALGV